MTPEFLLEAIGLLDDDLIVQAQSAPVRRTVPWRQWLGLCACLALVVFIGRGMVQNWSSSSGAVTSAQAGNSSAENGQTGAQPGPDVANGAIYLLLEGHSYVPSGEVTDTLPQGAREAGILSPSAEGAPSPSTNEPSYVGCALFAGPDGRLYVQLSQGTYAVFVLAEPNGS